MSLGEFSAVGVIIFFPPNTVNEFIIYLREGGLIHTLVSSMLVYESAIAGTTQKLLTNHSGRDVSVSKEHQQIIELAFDRRGSVCCIDVAMGAKIELLTKLINEQRLKNATTFNGLQRLQRLAFLPSQRALLFHQISDQVALIFWDYAEIQRVLVSAKEAHKIPQLDRGETPFLYLIKVKQVRLSGYFQDSHGG